MDVRSGKPGQSGKEDESADAAAAANAQAVYAFERWVRNGPKGIRFGPSGEVLPFLLFFYCIVCVMLYRIVLFELEGETIEFSSFLLFCLLHPSLLLCSIACVRMVFLFFCSHFLSFSLFVRTISIADRV